MARILLALLLLCLLGACGRSHRTNRCSDPPPPDLWSSYDPGYDPGYDDPGYVDPGYDDGGDTWSDISVEKPSGFSAPGTPFTVEAVNHDGIPYALHVLGVDPQGRELNLYLPPLEAAVPGGSTLSSLRFRLHSGWTYWLVLVVPGGRTLDLQPLPGAEVGTKTEELFHVVGGALLGMS